VSKTRDINKPGNARTRLRQLLKDGGTLVAPGAMDPLSALLIEHLGFRAIYLGGLVIAARLGTSEQTLSMSESVEAARLITRVTRTPLIVDAEAGFGDAIQVERTVSEFEAAAVAAIHLEDAHFPVRMQANPMISLEAMVTKIRVARATRSDPDFILIARTEAWGAPGGGIDEVRRRLSAYADAGADALIPMVFDREQAARIGEEFRGLPLVYFAASRRDPLPELSAAGAAEMGYQIVIYPAIGMGVAAASIISAYSRLRDEGHTGLAIATQTEAWQRILAVTRAPQRVQLENEASKGLTG